MKPAADACPVPVDPAPSWASLDLRRERRALGGKGLDLAQVLLARLTRGAEGTRLEILDRREAVTIPGELIASDTRLRGPRADHGDGRGLETSRADRRLALGGRGDPSLLHLTSDAPILSTDP